MPMNRRVFLKNSGMIAGSALLSSTGLSCSSFRQSYQKQHTVLRDIPILDTHTHPNSFYRKAFQLRPHDMSCTLDQMVELGIEAGVFSAIGDYMARGRVLSARNDREAVHIQLDYLDRWVDRKLIFRITSASELPDNVSIGRQPGAIYGIEGGDALEGRIDNLEDFFQRGVRIITLVHYISNDLADSMTETPRHLAISLSGRKIVNRMQELGVVIDVAHMSRYSLKDLVELVQVPVIDSHTNVVDFFQPGRRQRSYEEVELIVRTGGIVCTWPLRYLTRTSVRDWATEILQFKQRFGIEHIGLGSDGCGGLSRFVDGYRDIRDLISLAEAMVRVGLSKKDIQLFFGGNFKRVFESCVA